MLAQVPMKDDRKTGYKYGQKTAEGVIHPGEDLNSGKSGSSDLGLEINPMSDGEVIFVKNAGIGWGNIVVIYHPEISRLLGEDIYSRCAHFSKIWVKVGQKVTMADVVGLCGKSGTKSPHCHWEVLKKKLDRWDRYTRDDNGKPWSMAKVQEYFYPPYEFIERVNKLQSQTVPEFAEKAVEKAIKKMAATKWDNPNEVIGDATVEQVFINLGVLNKKEGNITKARFIVALDRLGVFD